MKAISPHPLSIEALGDGVVIHNRSVTAMECGIKAGNLWQIGRMRENGADRRKVVGLMKRRQRDIALEPREHVGVDENRTIKIGASMHDAVPDRSGVDTQLISQPRACRLQRDRHAGHSIFIVSAVHRAAGILAAGSQPRSRADAIHLTFDLAHELVAALQRKDLEFHAGRAGVDDENRAHRELQAAGTAAALRRASA